MSLSDRVHALSRKAVAVGRNYAAHAAEMGAPPPARPFWFFKPATSYLRADAAAADAVLRLPPPDAGAEHEVELVAVVGRRCSGAVSPAEARAAVRGYAVAVDVTARAWQARAKAAGLPWARAKGLDGFLPLGGVVGAGAVDARAGRGRLWLAVNGAVRQDGCVGDMTWSVADLVADIATGVTLEEWDLVLTGTPAGVGPLRAGDVVTAGFDGVDEMALRFRCE